MVYFMLDRTETGSVVSSRENTCATIKKAWYNAGTHVEACYYDSILEVDKV